MYHLSDFSEATNRTLVWISIRSPNILLFVYLPFEVWLGLPQTVGFVIFCACAASLVSCSSELLQQAAPAPAGYPAAHQCKPLPPLSSPLAVLSPLDL